MADVKEIKIDIEPQKIYDIINGFHLEDATTMRNAIGLIDATFLINLIDDEDDNILKDNWNQNLKDGEILTDREFETGEVVEQAADFSFGYYILNLVGNLRDCTNGLCTKDNAVNLSQVVAFFFSPEKFIIAMQAIGYPEIQEIHEIPAEKVQNYFSQKDIYPTIGE